MALFLHPDASLEAPDIEAQRAAVLGALQQQKAAALEAMAYTLDGQSYRVTLSVQDQIDVQTKMQLLAQQPAGTTTSWEIVNNVFIDMTAQDLGAMLQAGVAHVERVYAAVAQLAPQVQASDDPHSVDISIQVD